MRRYFITRGAKTTAGGTVVGGLTGFRITQVDIALEGEDRGLGSLETCLRSRQNIYEEERSLKRRLAHLFLQFNLQTGL